MSIKVTKRISLEFLGEDYKEGYLILRSIPLSEYKGIQEEIQKLGGDKDNLLALDYIQKLVRDRFEGGKIPQGTGVVEITADNLEDLPAEVFIQATQVLSGQPSPN